jgi:hypothetical protein
MKRIYLFCGVGCIVALFAVTAFSQSSKPASPCCESAQDVKATPCCEKPATIAGKPCCQTVEYAVKATPCCCNATAKKDTSCTSSAACCCAVTVKATATAPATKNANVYDLLEKLEGLQAKKDALESEIRETRALLNEKFRTLQGRVGKANVTPHGSPYAPAVTPVTSCEPVTTYRVILEKNPETGETKRVVTPVTNYIYRQSVQTNGVPLTAQPAAVTMPAPFGPPSPAVVPPCDAACPATPTTETIPTPESRRTKATKTARPATETPVSPKEEPQPKAPKIPPTANPSPK